jgi:H+/Cl- antiporter ClcA
MAFLVEVLKGVAIAVIGAVIINLFGLNGSKTVVAMHGYRKTKKWKTLIVLGAIAGVAGLYFLIVGIPNGGMENPNTQWGVTLVAVGLCFEIIGKFGDWWNS